MSVVTSAVVVANNLPHELLALSGEALAQANALTSKAALLIITHEQPTIDAASAVFKEMGKLTKGIAEQRLAITRPIDALKEAIIAAERKATVPLLSAIAELGPKIHKAEQERDRLREEAARKAREEAERKAKEERDRLEKARQELIAKQEAERAEAQRLADEEAAMFGEKAEPIAAPEPPPPVVIVPVVETPAQLATAVPKSAVRKYVKEVLVINDASKIPRYIEGIALLVPDEKAIEKLMKAGVKIDGCELVDKEKIGAAGSRGAA